MKRQAAFIAAAMLAAQAGAAETRGLGAHEHGRGTLDIALEGGRLSLALAAPGADIVGFEHAPGNDAQRAAIRKAMARLEAPLELFVLPSEAGCRVESAEARLLRDGRGDEAGGGAHDHGHADSGGAHDHDHDHHHDEEAAERGGEADGGHAEFRADYALTCDAPDGLGPVRFAYFELFPNAEALQVTVIGERGAARAEVTRSSPSLDLRDFR
jgi:hypothetical protein